MPYRKTKIAVNEIYHVFNRSIAKQPIFTTRKDCLRAVQVFKFYQYDKPPLRFSFYKRLDKEHRDKFFSQLKDSNKQIVEIICYCLMPNHTHFLLKNLRNNGIKDFMSNFQNSYAKYFNIKSKRTGPLFQPMFQAVRIESDDQLLHVSRYIHLNPVTSYLISIDHLTEYQWSSYTDYVQEGETNIQKSLILDHFKSSKDYQRFIFDQANYQQELNRIKHLIFEW